MLDKNKIAQELKAFGPIHREQFEESLTALFKSLLYDYKMILIREVNFRAAHRYDIKREVKQKINESISLMERSLATLISVKPDAREAIIAELEDAKLERHMVVKEQLLSVPDYELDELIELIEDFLKKRLKGE